MATLHVRNVPDELYERLRASAEDEGRSIGAQATALLQSALSDRDFRREAYARVRIGGQSPFRRRFAKSAKQLVVRGQQIAAEQGSPEVLPPHVLLAMLEDDVLRPTLERGGVTEESVRAALPPAARRLEFAPPLSADARQMLERALLASLDASLD
jgi:plasmid stability protein